MISGNGRASSQARSELSRMGRRHRRALQDGDIGDVIICGGIFRAGRITAGDHRLAQRRPAMRRWLASFAGIVAPQPDDEAETIESLDLIEPTTAVELRPPAPLSDPKSSPISTHAPPTTSGEPMTSPSSTSTDVSWDRRT